MIQCCSAKREIVKQKDGELPRRFVQAELLGKGGFGQCYKVIEVGTKIEYACKVISKKSLESRDPTNKSRHQQLGDEIAL